MTDLNAAAVLSVAVNGTLNLGAAIVLHPEICLPFKKFNFGDFFNLADRFVQVLGKLKHKHSASVGF